MPIVSWLLRLLSVEPPSHRRVQWPTREPRPPITLPKRFTYEDVKAIRKAKS